MTPNLPSGLPPQRGIGRRATPDWNAYRDRVMAEYRALLAGHPTEADMQAFFERNPSALPGPFPDGGGHGPWLDGLITQPHLRGIDDRRPDFIWLSRNTVQICPVLIEIESPDKKWVVGSPRSPQQSSDLTQALNQLRQWEEWFQEPANQEVFRVTYKVQPEWTRRPLRPQFWLIMGRTAENPTEIAKLRRYLTTKNRRVFTYDSAPIGQPEYKCDQFVTISPAAESGGFKVKHAPACMNAWDAVSPEEWRAVAGREQAVQQSTELDDEHKRLLIDDLELMEKWIIELEAYNAARRT